MIVTPIPTAAAPEINWSTPNILELVRTGDGKILVINEITTDTETNFLGLCIFNSTSDNEFYVPGRMYPGSQKDLFQLFDGQVTLNN